MALPTHPDVIREVALQLIREFQAGDPVELSELGKKELHDEDGQLYGRVVGIKKTVACFNRNGSGLKTIEHNPSFVQVYWYNCTGSTYGYKPKHLDYSTRSLKGKARKEDIINVREAIAFHKATEGK